MKAVEYINSLIKERDELKDLCKSHVETIRTMKKEFIKLNNEIVRKDKKIQKLENESLNIKTKNDLDKTKEDLKSLKDEFKNLKKEYKDLQSNYNVVVNENMELKRIFEEIENTTDSDE